MIRMLERMVEIMKNVGSLMEHDRKKVGNRAKRVYFLIFQRGWAFHDGGMTEWEDGGIGAMLMLVVDWDEFVRLGQIEIYLAVDYF